MAPIRASIELPAWLATITSGPIDLPGRTDEGRMQWAIELAQRNVSEGTGGPFAAIVVNESTGKCVAAGVNLVVSSGLSIAHAEAVAIMLAQHRAGSFDLAGDPTCRYTLYATGQPCIMCFGILWWSGITKLVCAARGEDVERITGFREGPLPESWPKLLAERKDVPIQVVHDIHREAACEVLRAYVAAGHLVYNPGSTVD
ncbi:nucleoside deaminase [Anatilimnocola sp. NA78]|uniref:nucleoside deaminase n=1 Tax=Anatilimnocola sp. NA78 TaxID=3415683 RepID=UPI003CE4DE34